jgi:hypothetical protein
MKFTTSLVAAATLLTTALGAPTRISARDAQQTWTITDFTISSEFPPDPPPIYSYPNMTQTTPTTYLQNSISTSWTAQNPQLPATSQMRTQPARRSTRGVLRRATTDQRATAPTRTQSAGTTTRTAIRRSWRFLRKCHLVCVCYKWQGADRW